MLYIAAFLSYSLIGQEDNGELLDSIHYQVWDEAIQEWVFSEGHLYTGLEQVSFSRQRLIYDQDFRIEFRYLDSLAE